MGELVLGFLPLAQPYTVIVRGERMKCVLSILAMFFLMAAVFAEDALEIPEGVRYKKASEKANEAAKALLHKRFSANSKKEEILSLFEPMLICGPGLWKEIEHDSTMSNIDTGNTKFHVPVLASDGKVLRTDQLEGKLFQTPDQVLAFWTAFTQTIDLNDLQIRKLNRQELRIFWAMIPFDIQEPLFILESAKHKLLVVFASPDKLRIIWIDDYQNMSIRERGK